MTADERLTRVENELCARVLANFHALAVAGVRLLAAAQADPAPAEEEQDAERWDGLS